MGRLQRVDDGHVDRGWRVAFKAMDKDGTLIALIGPWNPWLKFAKIGAPVLAAYQGAIVVTEAAETCARDRDPCHRCALPCRL